MNNELSNKIQNLFKIAYDLETMFPGRKFTPDGHMLGSIGEVIVAENYHLCLLPASTAIHDAVTPNGVQVQIKATQGKSISISSKPQHLIAILITPQGEWNELYNGPGDIVWGASGKASKTGQCRISVSRLRALNHLVPQGKKLSRSIQT